MWSSSYYDGDAWFMSDSLAFYLSTNTFRNPVFDEQFASSDDCQGSSGPEVKGRLGKLRSGLGARCSQLCDNLAFSLRSKLFVLELNFKRSLRRMRGFAKRHGLKLIPAPLDGRAGQGKQVAGCQASMQQTPWMHGALGSASRRDERKFWRKMGDSRASLGIQKEKILSRLEQVVQAKRNSEQKAHLRLNHLQLIRQGQAQLSGSSKGGRKGTADSSSSSSSSSSSNRGSNVCSDSNNNNVIDKKSAPKEDPTVGMHFGKLAGRCATNVSGNCKGASPASPLLPGGPVERQTCESGWKMKSKRLGRSTHLDTVLTRATSSKLDAGLESKRLCVVCYSNTPNIVTIPCKHDQICSDCFIEIIYVTVKHNQYPLRCVLCRQKIERIRCSRKLLLRVIEKNRVC